MVIALFGLYSTRSGWPFMSIISLDQIEIDPQDAFVSNGQLKGAYWVITFSVDRVEQITGRVTLPVGTEAEFDGSTVYTTREIVIEFDSQRAYFTRSMQSSTVKVVPQTYETRRNILAAVRPEESVSRPALHTEYWRWSEDKWNAHSVFEVAVSRDGAELGSRTFDTQGVTQDLDIDTLEGRVKVQYLGGLSGSWSAPQVGDLLLLSENYIYDSSVLQYMTYDEGGVYANWQAGSATKVQALENHNNPFSTYWYGEYRWTTDPTAASNNGIQFAQGTPAGLREDPGNPSVLFLNVASDLPGWQSGTDKRTPVAPVLFPNLMVPGMSVTEYLESRGLENMGKRGALNDRVFRGYGEDSWRFDYAKSAMIVTLPFTAYQVPVVQALIPVEMADTWVYQPATANVEIVGGGWMGDGGGEITTSQVCWVQVRQLSSIRSTATVSIESTSSIAQVSPTYEVLTMDPGETQTVYFTVTNKGVTSDIAGVLTFKAIDDWSGVTTSPFTLGYTLLKHEESPTGPQETEDTVLTLYVYDFKFDERVANYEIAAQSTARHLTGRTDGIGSVVFNFGKYEGRVTVTAEGTPDFFPETKSFNVGPGENEAVLRLESRAGPAPQPWWMEGWALNVTVIVLLVAFTAVVLMRKRRR